MNSKQKEELTSGLPKQERPGGIQDSLNVALATLSHYINNATMNISGQCEVLQMLHQSGDNEKAFAKIPSTVDLIRTSIRKISAVLEELSRLSNLENVSYLKNSKAVDIEAELKNRLDSSNIPV